VHGGLDLGRSFNLCAMPERVYVTLQSRLKRTADGCVTGDVVVYVGHLSRV